MSHSAAPCEPHHDSRADKRKTNSPTAAGLPALLCRPYRASLFLPAFLPAFTKAARSQNYRAFLHLKCFSRVRPKSKHMLKSSAHFRRQTSALPEDKGGIVRVWRAAPFSTNPGRLKCATGPTAPSVSTNIPLSPSIYLSSQQLLTISWLRR